MSITVNKLNSSFTTKCKCRVNQQKKYELIFTKFYIIDRFNVKRCKKQKSLLIKSKITKL